MVIGATADHRMLGMKPLLEDGPFKDVAIPFYVWASDNVKSAVDIHFEVGEDRYHIVKIERKVTETEKEDGSIRYGTQIL